MLTLSQVLCAHPSPTPQTAEQQREYKVFPKEQRGLEVLGRKSIAKLYSDKAEEVMGALRHDAKDAVPVLLPFPLPGTLLWYLNPPLALPLPESIAHLPFTVTPL